MLGFLKTGFATKLLIALLAMAMFETVATPAAFADGPRVVRTGMHSNEYQRNFDNLTAQGYRPPLHQGLHRQRPGSL